MKSFLNVDATQPHLVFAWLPITFLDRTSGSVCTVWLEYVERRLVSAAGITSWVYSLPNKEQKR